MKPYLKGVLLAALHLVIVGSLGAKLLYDRATQPRVWVRTVPYDPDLPIRGRYVSLRLQVHAEGLQPPRKKDLSSSRNSVLLQVREQKLIAIPDPVDRDWSMAGANVSWMEEKGIAKAFLSQPVLFFIPEHAKDPSRRPPGEELWAEVTLPKKGPPRPIRLGVKSADGDFSVLDLD
jgi:hypothetical protein